MNEYSSEVIQSQCHKFVLLVDLWSFQISAILRVYGCETWLCSSVHLFG